MAPVTVSVFPKLLGPIYSYAMASRTETCEARYAGSSDAIAEIAETTTSHRPTICHENA
jgi:hypothetical protein